MVDPEKGLSARLPLIAYSFQPLCKILPALVRARRPLHGLRQGGTAADAALSHGEPRARAHDLAALICFGSQMVRTTCPGR